MMKFWYNVGIHFYFLLIKLSSAFGNKKALKFINGRKQVFSFLQNQLKKYNTQNRIWVHVSSLGEFEQAKPILIALKKQFPEYTLILSFFSPSGMEFAKTDGIVDIKFYLPKDTPNNAKRLLDLLLPKLVIWIKYDFWHNYISECKSRNLPILLVSAHFRENQIYSKPWGAFFRSILQNFTHIYTQNTASSELLKNWGLTNYSTTGDTRIDSVLSSKSDEIRIPTIENFIQENKKIIVLGSAWEDDIEIFASVYKNIVSEYQLIIAPHDIHEEMIKKIILAFADYPIQKFTDKSSIESADIFILDTIGLLKHSYQYAVASWIGGGFKRSGIHNILEPAVYGNAIFFGPNYKKFPEATDLIHSGGATSSTDIDKISSILLDKDSIQKMGFICQKYILQHSGATQKVINDIKEII